MLLLLPWLVLKLAMSCLAQNKVEVLVVGAGASGLHTAYRLAENEVASMVVLEAQDRIGGRIHSVPINNDWIELGAQWIHGKGQNPLWKFVKETGIPVSEIASPAGEGKFLRDDGKEIPTEIATETYKAIEEFKEACEDAGGKPEDPESIGDFLQAEFEHWLEHEKPDDDDETRAWRRQFFKWILKVESFDTASDNLFNQSAISWCDYDEILPDTSFLNGYQSLLDVYQKFLTEKNIKIQLNTPVNKIKWQNNDEKVYVETSTGEKFEADIVVVSVSLGYLKKHHRDLFVPTLPEDTAKAIDTLKFGTTDKIFLEFETPFWDSEDPGFQFLWSGDAHNESYSDSDWVRHIFGVDGVLKQPNILEGFIYGQPARIMEMLSDEAVAEAVQSHLVSVLRKWKNDPEFQLPALKRTIVTRWFNNPYILGSYSYRETDSDLLDISFEDLAEPVTYLNRPKIFFVGEATTENYYSAVHGAVESGELTYKKILEAKK